MNSFAPGGAPIWIDDQLARAVITADNLGAVNSYTALSSPFSPPVGSFGVPMPASGLAAVPPNNHNNNYPDNKDPFAFLDDLTPTMEDFFALSSRTDGDGNNSNDRTPLIPPPAPSKAPSDPDSVEYIDTFSTTSSGGGGGGGIAGGATQRFAETVTSLSGDSDGDDEIEIDILGSDGHDVAEILGRGEHGEAREVLPPVVDAAGYESPHKVYELEDFSDDDDDDDRNAADLNNRFGGHFHRFAAVVGGAHHVSAVVGAGRPPVSRRLPSITVDTRRRWSPTEVEPVASPSTSAAGATLMRVAPSWLQANTAAPMRVMKASAAVTAGRNSAVPTNAMVGGSVSSVAAHRASNGTAGSGSTESHNAPSFESSPGTAAAIAAVAAAAQTRGARAARRAHLREQSLAASPPVATATGASTATATATAPAWQSGRVTEFSFDGYDPDADPEFGRINGQPYSRASIGAFLDAYKAGNRGRLPKGDHPEMVRFHAWVQRVAGRRQFKDEIIAYRSVPPFEDKQGFYFCPHCRRGWIEPGKQVNAGHAYRHGREVCPVIKRAARIARKAAEREAKRAAKAARKAAASKAKLSRKMGKRDLSGDDDEPSAKRQKRDA